MAQPTPSTSGQEPALGGELLTLYTGAEPMLGGIRRAAADVERLRVLLDHPSAEERRHTLDMIKRFGQEMLFARELILIIPARARQKQGNWRGTFTPGQRVRALEALAQLGSAESIPVLLDALADTTYRHVQMETGRALAAIYTRLDPADEQTIKAYFELMARLHGLPLAGRNVATRILSAAPPELVLPMLLGRGLKISEWQARREVVRVLGMLGDKRATRRLIETLGDEVGTVRASAAWALGQLDAPIAVPPLVDASLDGDEVVRAAAVEALGSLLARLEPLDQYFKLALNSLLAALGDSDRGVRLAAMDSLNNAEGVEVRLALAAYLSRQKARS